MDESIWLAMPDQVERQVGRWLAEAESSRLLTVDHLDQYGGERAFALTATEPGIPREEKRAVWFCVPHAHEPAGTAASMDVLNQLLTDRDLQGQPSEHDTRRIRRELLITFNPDANPSGRCWSPVLWWDGSRYSNQEFFT